MQWPRAASLPDTFACGHRQGRNTRCWEKFYRSYLSADTPALDSACLCENEMVTCATNERWNRRWLRSIEESYRVMVMLQAAAGAAGPWGGRDVPACRPHLAAVARAVGDPGGPVADWCVAHMYAGCASAAAPQ
eukprot:jgi/Ulvmu1/6708/UM030_0041.1